MASTHPRIAALSVDIGGPKAPSEFRLIPAGRFKSADGSGRPVGIPDGWLMTATLANRLIVAAALRANDYVIDYDHQTLYAEKNGQPALAAGWFKSMEWRDGDGLYATGVRWTATAAARIHAGECRYISPMFLYAADGSVIALLPAALTNNPGLDGLTDLSTAALSAYFPEEERPMKELLKAIGLAETATEAEALAALSALRSTHTGELAALKSKTPDPAQYVSLAVLSATQGELATARTELAALKSTQHVAEVGKVVAAALTAGKLTPATEAWARELGQANLAALNSFIAAAPVVVAPGATQTGGAAPAGAGIASQPAGTDLAVMKALGLTAEQFVAGKQEA